MSPNHTIGITVQKKLQQSFLFNVDKSPLVYILKTAALIVVINYIPTFLKNILFEETANERTVDVIDIVLATTIDPFIETLLMMPILFLTQRFMNNFLSIALVNAIFWAFIHSLFIYYWWVSVFIPFFIFTLSFLVWSKVSRIQALFIVTAIHGIYNGLQTIVH